MENYAIQLYAPRTLTILESAGVPQGRLVERVGLGEAENLDEVFGTLSKGFSAARGALTGARAGGWSGALAGAGEGWRQRAAAQVDARRRAVDAVRKGFKREKDVADVRHNARQNVAGILHRSVMDREHARAMDAETAARQKAAKSSAGGGVGAALKAGASKTANALKSAWSGLFAAPPPRSNQPPAPMPTPAAKSPAPAAPRAQRGAPPPLPTRQPLARPSGPQVQGLSLGKPILQKKAAPQFVIPPSAGAQRQARAQRPTPIAARLGNSKHGASATALAPKQKSQRPPQANAPAPATASLRQAVGQRMANASKQASARKQPKATGTAGKP